MFLWLRGSPASRGVALLAGAAVGYLLLLHARNAGLVAALLGIAAYRSRRWSSGASLLFWFLAGAAALFMVRTAVTYHFWGTWVTTPHARLEATSGVQAFFEESFTRLAGWLFDQEHGLLPYAPIYLLLPIGWISLWRLDRELCIEISAIAVAYVGVMAVPALNVHGWRGGWTPAARFLVPVVPFLSILVFAAVARLPRVPVLVWLLAALQVGLDAILWRRPGLLWNKGTGTSALLSYVDGGTGRLSSRLPSLLPPIGARTVAILAALVIVWGLLTFWLTRTRAFRSDGLPHGSRNTSASRA